MRILGLLPLLLLGFCQADETISAYAGVGSTWELVSLDDQPADGTAHLSFPQKGHVAGKGPCNSFTARQSAPYPWIEIRQIAATRRTCPGLAAEQTFFRALQAMTLAEVSGNLLILTDEAGRTLTFERQTKPMEEQ